MYFAVPAFVSQLEGKRWTKWEGVGREVKICFAKITLFPTSSGNPTSNWATGKVKGNRPETSFLT